MEDTHNFVIGTHIRSDINEMVNTLDTLQCYINCVQFFVDPANDYNLYKDVKKKLKEKEITAFIHSSYRINIAKEWDDTSWWVKYLIYEIKTAHLLGVKGIVIHTGNRMGLNNNVAINNMYSFLLHIDRLTQKEKKVKILIETPSGQGTEMLTNFDKFLEFMNKFRGNNRFGMCLDTCHIFSAGYDIREKSVLSEMISKVRSKIGIDKLKLIHLNDSKDDLGQKRDRHDSLGYGYIGRVGLKKIIRRLKKLDVPIILETPIMHHESEIKWIISL